MHNKLQLFLERIYDFNDYSEETLKNAERIISDTVASVLYGLGDEEVKKLIHVKHTHNQNDAQLLASNKYLSKNDLIFIYGIAAVSNELDEGNTEAKGHPGSQIIPALLTIEDKNITTDEVLKAFIKSYEISSRVARALHMHNTSHPHGTWGMVGYVAFKSLLNNDKDTLIKSIELALSLPLTTSWYAAENGLTVRNAYSGFGSLIANNIIDLTNAGFTTNEQVIHDVYSEKLGKDINYDSLLEDNFDIPMVNKNYFKVYPSCRFTHGAIDAIERIMSEHVIDTDNIKYIHVSTYNLASRCNKKNVDSQLGSKFSIPYLIGVTLLNLNPLSPFETNQRKAKFIIEKVGVEEDKDYTRLLPELRVTKVSIVTNDNHTYESEVKIVKGEYSNPISDEELKEKYRLLFTDRDIKTDIKTLTNISQFKYFTEWLTQL